MPGLASAYRHR